jgi:hypothetical protein
MDDQTPSQAPTPGQVLAGGNPPPAPLNWPIGAPQQNPQTPPQPQTPPTPQQVVNARHNAIGKAASFLFGQERDPNTGQRVKQPSGQLFRSLLAGFLLGGAIGSQSQSTSPTGGFISGLARGGNAVIQQDYQRQQDALAQRQKQQSLSLEEQREADEHMQHQAAVAKIIAETSAFHHQQQQHDQDVIDKKNAAAAQYVQSLTDAGGTPAPIAINGQVPANGIYSAPDLAAAFVKDPTILSTPNGVRHFVDTHDASDLEYVDGKGWVNQSGDPVDLSKSTTVRVVDVPENLYRMRLTRTGKELNTIAGYQFVPKDKEDSTFNVPLDAVATLYGQNLKNANSAAQAKQREASAAKSNAQATKGNAPKRGTPAQFAAVEAKKAAALAKAEANYERDGDQDVLQKAKTAAQNSYEAEIKALGGTVTQPPTTLPAGPKKGDTQIHAGFIYTFDGQKWVKGQPAQ